MKIHFTRNRKKITYPKESRLYDKERVYAIGRFRRLARAERKRWIERMWLRMRGCVPGSSHQGLLPMEASASLQRHPWFWGKRRKIKTNCCKGSFLQMQEVVQQQHINTRKPRKRRKSEREEQEQGANNSSRKCTFIVYFSSICVHIIRHPLKLQIWTYRWCTFRTSSTM